MIDMRRAHILLLIMAIALPFGRLAQAADQARLLTVDVISFPDHAPRSTRLTIENPAAVYRGHTTVQPTRFSERPQLLRFTVDDGSDFLLELEDFKSAGNVYYMWHGVTHHAASAASGSAKGTFVTGGGVIVGTVRTATHEYRLRTAEDGRHSVTKVDLSKLNPNINDVAQIDPRIYHRPIAKIAAATVNSEKSAPIQVRGGCAVAMDYALWIMPYGFTYHLSDAMCLFGYWETTRAFADSGINVEITPHYPSVPFYRAGGTFVNELAYFSSLPHVLNYRDQNSIDIMTAIVPQTNPTLCGVAMTLLPTEAQAYAVVAWDSTCDYTFEHEVAHLFSADHDQSNISLTNTKAYAKAYVKQHLQEGQWYGYTTLMAYNGALPCHPTNFICERLHQFSTPLVQHDFSGTAIGGTNHDNARAIREEATRISQFR